MTIAARATLVVALFTAALPSASRAAPESIRFTLDEDTARRIGLETAALASAELAPTVSSPARVLDPATLVSLDTELATLSAAFTASAAEAARLATLYSENENVSARAVERAEAERAADRSRMEDTRRRLALAWGTANTTLDDDARRRLVEQLVGGRAILVRVELPAAVDVEHGSDVVLALDPRAPTTFSGRVLGLLPTVDPQLQSRGLLVEVSPAPAGFAIGSRLVAKLQAATGLEHGVILPRSALFFRAGALWAYVRLSALEYERRPVGNGRAVPEGRFVTEGFAAGELVVSAGVADLLAAEQAPPPGVTATDESDDD